MITEAAIRKEIRAVEAGRKTAATLTDPAPRGAGRLALVVKPGRAEWYAQRWAAGRRSMQKLGGWPFMGIAEARDRHSGVGRTLGDRATLQDLIDAYLQTMEGRTGYSEARRILALVTQHLPGSRLARGIEASDIVPALRAIYLSRGASTADRARAWLSAAFGWAVPAANDYRAEKSAGFGVRRNPVLDIAKDSTASKPGTHWLQPVELVQLIGWLQAGRPNRARTAAMLLALTGQRGPQLRRIRADQWNSAERVLSWLPGDMKIPKPHRIPVPEAVAAMLDALRPDAHGLLLAVGRSTVQELLAAAPMHVTARDLRRTWKTLAAAAGLTKAERDDYQAHGLKADVAEIHYNMWEGLPEKRAALVKWERWLEEQLRQHGTDQGAQQVVQPKQHARGEQVTAVMGA